MFRTGRRFTMPTRFRKALDLNLPGNLDHILGGQIEPFDHLSRVPIKKLEQGRAPASQSGALLFWHDQIPRTDEHGMVEIDRGVEPVDIAKNPPQIRDFEEPETRHQVPKPFPDAVDDGAVGAV